jgi:hypothetical protein
VWVLVDLDLAGGFAGGFAGWFSGVCVWGCHDAGLRGGLRDLVGWEGGVVLWDVDTFYWGNGECQMWDGKLFYITWALGKHGSSVTWL